MSIVLEVWELTTEATEMQTENWSKHDLDVEYSN